MNMKTTKAQHSHNPLSVILIVGIVIFTAILGTRMTIKIIQRRVLQHRAAEFIATQQPNVLRMGSKKLYSLLPDNECLSRAHAIIERYAQQGILNMSAGNQCRMNSARLETMMCLFAVESNQEAKVYVEECQVILDKIEELEYYRAWKKE